MRHSDRPSRIDAKVYFMQREDLLIKIGFSHDASKRSKQLMGANACDLKILLTMDGGQPLETELHKRFKIDNHHGEWFRPSLELMNFINENIAKDKVNERAATARWATTSLKIANDGASE